MPIKVRTKRILIVAIAVITCLLVGGLVFVFYFMHSVYETEQVLGAADVPALVRESFEKQFPGAAEVAWELEDNLYEAEFRWAGRNNVEAHFDRDGKWAKTVFPIRVSDLPEKAQVFLKSQSEYEVTEPERILAPGPKTEYEVKLANKLMEWNYLFDAEGSLISQTRDGPVLE